MKYLESISKEKCLEVLKEELEKKPIINYNKQNKPKKRKYYK